MGVVGSFPACRQPLRCAVGSVCCQAHGAKAGNLGCGGIRGPGACQNRSIQTLDGSAYRSVLIREILRLLMTTANPDPARNSVAAVASAPRSGRRVDALALRSGGWFVSPMESRRWCSHTLVGQLYWSGGGAPAAKGLLRRVQDSERDRGRDLWRSYQRARRAF